jgi:hypothetical protein
MKAVLSLQRWGALTETVSLVTSEPIVLTEKLKGEKMASALELLRQMVENVLQHNRSAKL